MSTPTHEYVLQLDHLDRPGLGYEIFTLMEQNGVDKIAMEAIPGHGMVIKFRCAGDTEARRLLELLPQISGVQAVSFRDQMPHEEREQELAAILNAVSEGIIAVDHTGRIRHINPVACLIFGCREADVTGQAAEMLLGDNPPLLRTLASGQSYHLKERQFTRQGRTVRYLSSGVPVPGAGGRIIGAVATIKDFRQVEEMIAKVDKLRRLTTFDDIVHQSENMQRLLQRARTVARSGSTVLLRGESGTGKELLASAIHMEGLGFSAPFVAVNCAALPDTLLESELFGYEEGAFTGAVRGGKKGLFEQADGGTLFLDEIGEVSPALQVKLLRVLQQNVIRRLGGDREIPVNVRIIAATHRDLEDMLKTGRFREDLYYRLNVIPLSIPPLRERREDIPLIAHRLLQRICTRLHLPQRRLTPEAAALLTRSSWPGNIRQLENTLERLVNLTDAAEILPMHLQDWTEVGALPDTAITGADALTLPLTEPWPPLKQLVATVEKEVLRRVLAQHPSSRAAGQVLGVSNTTILNKIHEYGLELPRR
ncbi:MAG TPA: sigma 54-interacting transcriptional regulator [Patescibacteria group bacterium]|nr:sigma 54-interacting transcriptional regulator [Patescibacteria group bacterium]